MSFFVVENLTVAFSGLKALNGVNLSIEKNQIFGLIGPNGAGKSTLLNCLSRIYTPQYGSVSLAGSDVLAYPVHRIVELGICRTFQNLELFSDATVTENIILGCVWRYQCNLISELFALPSATEKMHAARAEAEEIQEELGLSPYADMRVSDLPYGIQKSVELARALAGRPRLLLLDEPAAGLNPEESIRLGGMIRHLRDKKNITVLLVEHDMPLVMSICDHIVVLDHGEKLCSGSPVIVRNDPRVVEAYLGTETTDA
jgi:branched-chain amino acid transport system ATP-binding protein